MQLELVKYRRAALREIQHLCWHKMGVREEELLRWGCWFWLQRRNLLLLPDPPLCVTTYSHSSKIKSAFPFIGSWTPDWTLVASAVSDEFGPFIVMLNHKAGAVSHWEMTTFFFLSVSLGNHCVHSEHTLHCHETSAARCSVHLAAYIVCEHAGKHKGCWSECLIIVT